MTHHVRMTRTCQIDIPAESAGGHPYSHTTEILPQFSSESTQFFFSFFYFSVDLNPKGDIIKWGVSNGGVVLTAVCFIITDYFCFSRQL